MKRKHSKARKFLLTFLIVFGVGTSGLTGYAVITGNMPPILSMISSSLFTSGSGSKIPEKVELQLDSESSPSINPQEILSTTSTTASTPASSVDPDAKIDENQLSPQGTETPLQPISVTTSQEPTSTSSHTAATSSSSSPVTSSSSSQSSVSSAPESSVSSVPDSSSSHHSSPQISSVTLDRAELTLNKGDISPLLTAVIAPANASGNKTIIWTSSDASVATVDSFGHITAISRGTTQITANTSNGKTAACAVTVLVPAQAIKINSENFSIDKGAGKTLTATVMPEDATDKTIIWATSNNDVVSVDAFGKIIAEKAGTASITATTGDGKFSTTCDITVGISISSLTLNKAVITLIKGTEENLTATIDPPDTTENSTIKWTSSNTSVATVDSNGKITALARGTSTITAETGTHCAECVVTVIVPANGISLSKATATLVKGTEEILKATIFPEDSTDNEVLWTSSDESIAMVNSTGTVTAVSVGTSVIMVTTHDGNFKSKCTVTVVIPVTGITLAKTELTMIKGISESLIAAITPIDATDQAVVWASSDTNIATVDESGKITAVNGGTANITVKTHDGNFIAECKLTVIVPVSGISLNKAKLTLVKGTEESLTAAILPEDATNKNVLWATSNSDVCAVDEKGKVTAVNTGAAVITASSEDGGYTAQSTVIVVIPVTGVSMNKTELTLVKGTNETLIATISPSDATDKAVIWSSSDTNVATVDAVGRITAVMGGTATIKVTTHDGNFTAECKVTVIVPVSGISLNKVALTMVKGKDELLTATISPDDATNKTVLWATSNSDVCTVDENGKVTAIIPGTAIITATSEDGGRVAQCAVTVVIPVTGITINKLTTTLMKGTYETLTASIAPVDATNRAVSWSSTNTSIATVAQDGKITAMGVGTATITATTSDGSFTVQCTVMVTPDTYIVSANAVNGYVTGTGTHHVGSAVTLTAIPNAHYHFTSWSDGVTTASRTVTVTQDVNVSANFEIDYHTITGLVDADGAVTGGGDYPYGSTAIITAVPDDGYDFSKWSDGVTSVSRSFIVTGNLSLTAYFTEKPSTVALNRSSTKILVGSHYTFASKLKSNGTTVVASAWKSSNPSVIQVDSTGTMTALGLGTAKVISNYTDGTVAVCKVQVVDTVHCTYAKSVISWNKDDVSAYNAGVSYNSPCISVASYQLESIKKRKEGSKTYYDNTTKELYKGTFEIQMDALVSITSVDLGATSLIIDHDHIKPSFYIQASETGASWAATTQILIDENKNVISGNYALADRGASDILSFSADIDLERNLKQSGSFHGSGTLSINCTTTKINVAGGQSFMIPNQDITINK